MKESSVTFRVVDNFEMELIRVAHITLFIIILMNLNNLLWP